MPWASVQRFDNYLLCMRACADKIHKILPLHYAYRILNYPHLCSMVWLGLENLCQNFVFGRCKHFDLLYDIISMM